MTRFVSIFLTLLLFLTSGMTQGHAAGAQPKVQTIVGFSYHWQVVETPTLRLESCCLVSWVISNDLLNRTLAWTNNQNKTVKVVAHPDARVWFNGTEILNFPGNYNYSVPSPGAAGGWVPWHTLAVLEGEGDAGAFPDAKAEQSGAVWVPPTTESFTYDAAGNRESSALWNYGWDAKNQLVRSQTKNYNNSTAPQGYDITNAYDAEGRRFSKKVSRYQNGSIVEKKVITFLHDGNDIIYERQQLESGLTTCERKYLWGPDISGTQGGAGGAGGLLLIRETKGDQTIDLYPLYDGTGHVIALATMIDGTATLVAEYAYGPFGEPIYARGPHAQSCPFRYATKYYDQETGLYDFGRRYLDPITGQWLSREPLGESESMNLYSYCHNDPVNNVDVLGFATVAIGNTLHSSLESLSDTLAKLDQGHTASLLDAALGKNAKWVTSRQYTGKGESFGSYISGVIAAAEGAVEKDVGFQNNLRLWAITASSSALTSAAETGNFDADTTQWLHEQSQLASNSAHNWELASGTTQGLAFIGQPEIYLIKGVTAGVLAIKGLALADDAFRIGIRAEDFADDFVRAAVPDGKFYSTAFEMKLDYSVYGRYEKVHFNRANAALEEALRANPDFAAGMDNLSPGILDYVSAVGGRQNPLNFMWHHDATPGIMRLVPTEQHTAGSIFWRTLHPDPGAAGGYSIWAIPAGAPKR